MTSVLTPANRLIIRALAQTRRDAKWMILDQRRYIVDVEEGRSPSFTRVRDWRRALAQVLLRRLHGNPWLLIAPLGAAVLYVLAALFYFVW